MRTILVLALAVAMVAAVPAFAVADPANCDGRLVDFHYHSGTDIDQCFNSTYLTQFISGGS